MAPEATPARQKAPLTQRQQSAETHRDYLTARQKMIGTMLGDSELKAEQVVGAALAYIAATPALWPCDTESVYDAVIAAAKRNLLVGPEGYAYLVPYKQRDPKTKEVVRVTCTYQLGYKGALELMRRSGAYTVIQAFVVHENEVKRLRVRRGTNGYFEFDPIVFGPRGKAIGYIVFARLTTGEFDYEAMDVEAVNMIRGRSQAYQNGGDESPWGTDYDRMALKTVIKRFGQRAEMSPTDRRQLNEDDEKDRVDKAIDVSPAAVAARVGSLPSADQSGAIRVDQTMPTQAERVKATMQGEPATDGAPQHDPKTGEVIDDKGAPVATAADGTKTTKRKGADKGAADAAKPEAAKPDEPAAAAAPKVDPAAGFAAASQLIDSADEATEPAELTALEESFKGLVESGKIGTTHATKVRTALDRAHARVAVG